MYTKSAELYDAIYSEKDYQAEARAINRLIWEHRRSTGNRLLDVACGTAKHLEYLSQHQYSVLGVDISRELLAVAHQRCPGVDFYVGDMVDFDMGFQVDALTCLFSAIGYVRTFERLQQAIGNMARHLKPGGVMIVEPWFSPDTWTPGTLHATVIDRPDLKITRMTISDMQERTSINVMHYLVGTPDGITYFTERHELGLFTHHEYMDAFRRANLDVIHDPDGLTGRGLYIGRNALE
ncbi:MAG: class I SAM-dependent methyltransferase [Anaerolineae bacterium]|nr:class I SAM-dependent methyltransferase [Anaerolineae bacterium]